MEAPDVCIFPVSSASASWSFILPLASKYQSSQPESYLVFLACYLLCHSLRHLYIFIADMAGELWLLLIQLAGKVKSAEECMPRIRQKENRDMVDDFIESGERLTTRLKKLLKTCETPILKAGKENSKDSAQLGKNAGTVCRSHL